MAKKTNVTNDELRSMLPWLLALNGVYFVLLLVLFFAGGFDYTLLLGGVWGNVVGIGNFWLLGKSAESALRRRDAKSARSYMNTMYCIRYLGMFLALTLAAVLPFISVITAALPLFFPRIAITLKALWETRSERRKGCGE
ncbi:MAG: hypothetical protein ACI4WS_07080 [Oscillospiraceae bacterium]